MTAKWTWLVYMAGDNNLEGAGREDLREMQKVGSTKDVNVLVQFDTEAQKTMRYRVEKGHSVALQTMRGVDCGDPKVLTDFIKWGVENFPAEKYAVVVWNHGGGWEDADLDFPGMRDPKPKTKAILHRSKRTVFRTTREKISMIPGPDRMIAIDCGAQDYLDNEELRKAIENAKTPIELLGCDACLMNMVEIAYEMRKTATVMVGSEETEPGQGWPYTEILTKLTANPSMGGVELAKDVVTSYGAWYRAHGHSVGATTATQSAYDMKKVEGIYGAVDGLAKVLVSKMDKVAAAVALARAKVLQFETEDYIDLGDFCTKLDKATAGLTCAAAVAAETKKVHEAIKTGILANETFGKEMEPASGVSISFPQKGNRLIKEYRALAFGKSNGWTDFLAAYHGA